MSAVLATQGVKCAELHATVTRLCRCQGEPVPDPNDATKFVSRCGHAPKVERLGCVAYHHRNPLKRLAARLRGIRGRFTRLGV